MNKLKQFLKASGFDEYPEQLMALGFARDLFSNGVSLEEVEALINQILADTGEDLSFDEEEKTRW